MAGFAYYFISFSKVVTLSCILYCPDRPLYINVGEKRQQQQVQGNSKLTHCPILKCGKYVSILYIVYMHVYVV